MKKLIYTIILLFLHLSLFSQTEKEEKRLIKGLSINVKKIDFRSNQKNYEELESSFGIDLQGSYFYEINNRLILKTGVELSYLTSHLKNDSYIFQCDVTAILNGVEVEQSYVKSTMNWFYINIPIELQYNLVDKEKRIYLKGGLDNLIHIYGNSKAFLYECGENPSEFYSGLTFDAKRFFGQVNLGVGMEFNIGTSNKLFIEPNVEYAFSNVIDVPTTIGGETKSRILNFGIQSGIRF
ncbi:MAG: outer membrane beta-barrel protein [Saprospiraceae bacterium]